MRWAATIAAPNSPPPLQTARARTALSRDERKMGVSNSKSQADYANLGSVLGLPELIIPELLLTELHGAVSEDNFIGKAMEAISNISKINAPSLFSEEDAISFEQVASMTQPGMAKMEHGYARCKDGSLYIAVLTDLGDIKGELFDWWFSQCDDEEKYRWWHPQSHMSCTFDAPFYAAMPWERRPGHYIDHTQVVEEIIDGNQYVIHYEYLRPSRFFDTNMFGELGITACVVARIHVDDPKLGQLAIGYVVHMVRETENGKSELRSRYWLGDVCFAETPENYYFAQVMDSVANTWLLRRLKLPMQLAQELMWKVIQQMASLNSFLPSFHRRVIAQQKEFQQSFDFHS